MPGITRRQLLAAAGTAGAVSLLSACTRPIFIPVTCKVPAPSAAAPVAADLTIDAHCHIFNGTDLQAEKFLSLVEFPKAGAAGIAINIVAVLLQDLVWSDAPDGQAEVRVIDSLLACSDADVDNYLEQYRAISYQHAHDRIRGTRAFRDFAAQKQKSAPLGQTGHLSRNSVLSEMDQRLKPKYSDYRSYRDDRRQKIAEARNKAKTSPGAASAPDGPIAEDAVAGALDYIIQNFQYRCVTVHEYRTTFDQAAGRQADLMLAAMVDYDWWLAQGVPTRTSLADQVTVMERISALTRGRVHGLAPFDPLREVAFQSGQKPQTQSSLALVQQAIRQHGCVGVKLYPPMGFAAWGNADVEKQTPGFWSQSWLPAWLAKDVVYKDPAGSAGIGQRLDDAMSALYEWCIKEEVPILAHTAMSNGPSSDFEQLAGADHWQKALNQFTGLRISFGHFGDFTDVDVAGSGAEAAKFAAAISTQGSRAFADVSFASAIFAEQPQLQQRFESYYKTYPALGGRIMYGTDWDLLMHVGDVSSYQQRCAEIFAALDSDQSIPSPAGSWKLSQRFFGYNAVDWIGLRKGECARGRLEDFYRNNKYKKIDVVNNPPGWMKKLDS